MVVVWLLVLWEVSFAVPIFLVTWHWLAFVPYVGALPLFTFAGRPRWEVLLLAVPVGWVVWGMAWTDVCRGGNQSRYWGWGTFLPIIGVVPCWVIAIRVFRAGEHADG
jgi:hypothetical protein